MSESQNRKCLLITGTIIPNSNFVAESNSDQRRNQYYEALCYYISELPSVPKYFVENSSYDFKKDEDFGKLFEKDITLIKFPVSQKISEGKGYQEFEMLDAVVSQLKGKYDSFIKVTGRYQVVNLDRILNAEFPDLLMDLHKIPKVGQTNVFGASLRFYESHIKNLYLSVNDEKGEFIEKVIYRCLKEKGLIRNVTMFPFNPVIKGTSGSYGGTLNRNKYKMMFRNVERSVLKTFGIKQFLVEY